MGQNCDNGPIASSKLSLSIVIPCYNEEEGILNLVQKLAPAVAQLQTKYEVELIFVDDGSIDHTNELLHQYYGNDPKAKIIKHDKNKNLGAALRTGFLHASGDFVAALDSDCTYDPLLLSRLLEMMDEHTDIVTVSPYHPDGKIRDVPGYRILLSKGASFLYRLMIDWQLHTYTAMVRVYRKEVIKNIQFKADNFLGVTELLARSMLQGYKVKEYPAELCVRKFGTSKMKAVPFKVIGSHLSLLSKVAAQRLMGKGL